MTQVLGFRRGLFSSFSIGFYRPYRLKSFRRFSSRPSDETLHRIKASRGKETAKEKRRVLTRATSGMRVEFNFVQARAFCAAIETRERDRGGSLHSERALKQREREREKAKVISHVFRSVCVSRARASQSGREISKTSVSLTESAEPRHVNASILQRRSPR